MKNNNGHYRYRWSFRFLAWGALIGIFVCGFFAGLFMREVEQKITLKTECGIEEDVLLGRINTDINNKSDDAISSHVNNMMIYKRLAEAGCEKNREKYVALEKTERKYIEVLRGEVVPIVEHIEKPCVAVEHLVEKDLWPSESRDYYNHVDNAVVYSKLAKSGCPEKSEVYRKKIQYELQIALGLSDGVKPECQWTGKMMEIFVNTKSLSQAKTYLERCADGFSPESLDWWRENIDTIIK